MIKEEKILTSKEVAKYLDIPLLSVGQLVFERKLPMQIVDKFKQKDVENLKNTDLTKYK